jgi:subfamily B ATP-binding cassette protein MsbA
MKEILEIYRYTFVYRTVAILTILCNLLFVIFNLLSLVLFIPFLQLIFKAKEISAEAITKPVYDGTVNGLVDYFSGYYGYFTKNMIKEDPLNALFFVCISVLIAFFFKNLFRYGAVWYQSQLRMAVVRDVRNKLFDKAMRLPLSFFTEEHKGDMMSRMNSDVGEIEIAVVSILELIFREPIAVVIHVWALVYINPQLTLISFILLPISALVISRIGKSLKKTAKAGQEQMGLLYSSLDENLGGIRIIKAFNAVPQVLKSFKKINLDHQVLITRTFRKRDLSPLLNETLGSMVMICLVWFGGSMILNGTNDADFTGQEFIGFIIVFSQLLRPIHGISNCVSYLQKARASQERINEILDADERIYETENPISLKELETGIVYDNVSFKYRNEWVLRNVSFTINKGETVALVGESGSGKSTIADLLPRFYDVVEGRVLYDNVPITEASIIDLRDHIGIVTQESILFNDSVYNNISFGMNDVTREAVMQAAKIANAHEFIMNLEEGYDTNIGERGNKLSGGQKQRVSIARAILKNPPIMILDEATSALDTESEKLVQEALEKLMKNRTSLVIAHRLSTIKKADRIIVLSKGEIKEVGTHDELMEKQGLYYNLCTLQGIAV